MPASRVGEADRVALVDAVIADQCLAAEEAVDVAAARMALVDLGGTLARRAPARRRVRRRWRLGAMHHRTLGHRHVVLRGPGVEIIEQLHPRPQLERAGLSVARTPQ